MLGSAQALAVRKLFTWGHISEADYMREVERLTATRDELRGAVVVRPKLRLDGISELWERSNAAERRALLAEFFDRLIVKDGEIVNYVPRADRVTEVIDSVGRAIPDGVIHNVPTEYAWRAKGRPRKNGSKSGKGGIRTPRWTYRPRFG
jgi:hypothetical protein